MANEIVRISGQNFYQDELYHHGVLGMKWGFHIFGKKGKSSNKKKSKPKTETLQSKLNKMSDEELKKSATRLQLEVSYKTNYEKLYPVQVSKGKQFITDMKSNLRDAALEGTKQAATNFARDQVSKMLNKMMESDDKKK